MLLKSVDPYSVLGWHEIDITSELEAEARARIFHYSYSALREMVVPFDPVLKTIGSDRVIPVPVFELPHMYLHIGDYALLDGHRRLVSAKLIGAYFPVLVVQCADDFRYVEGYNRENLCGMSQSEFEQYRTHTIDCCLSFLERE